MPEPINELLVVTRQEILRVFKEWYADDENYTLQDAIEATDYIVYKLNENKV